MDSVSKRFFRALFEPKDFGQLIDVYPVIPAPEDLRGAGQTADLLPEIDCLSECPHCQKPIVVDAAIENGVLVATSTGYRAGCRRQRCGRNVPKRCFAIRFLKG